MEQEQEAGRSAAPKPRQPQRRYSRAFKDEACNLVSRQGYTQQRAAEQLGVPLLTLKGWLKERGLVTRAVTHQVPDSDDPDVLKAQLRELQQRVRRLEQEKEILKKATAFFAGERT